eukprot:14457756-Alexandrium_andersonii.AAC.1
MSASLVGSEMCIRDSVRNAQSQAASAAAGAQAELLSHNQRLQNLDYSINCLLYTSDAADDM